MKQIRISLFFTLFFLLIGCFVLTSCVENNPPAPHTHGWAINWSTDDTHHWYECSKCTEQKDYAAHSFDEWIEVTPATETSEGLEKRICSECEYEQTRVLERLPHMHDWAINWSTDDTHHWYDCSKCTEQKDYATHEFVDGTCICGKSKYSEGLTFSENEIGCIVTGIGSCIDTDLIIPSVYNGKPVTAIQRFAFGGCTTLTAVNVPDSVTTIGDYAFDGCTSLTAITIPNSVTMIDERAFEDCEALTFIAIPDSVTTIGKKAFGYCYALIEIVISNSVTSLGDDVFLGCVQLEKIYYTGTPEEWKTITMGADNADLNGATRYDYSETEPTKEGNYWHYGEDGVTVVEWVKKESGR